MQDFGTKADNSPPPGGQLSAAEFNNLATENENAVSRSGQTLSGASDTQLAQSLFLHGVKSESFQDSGAANAYVATPVSGASGVLLPGSYAELDGAVIAFKASNANSGASTLNLGQTTGTLLGVKAIVDESGAPIVSGSIKANAWLQLRYDSSIGSGSWVLLPWSVNTGKLLGVQVFTSSGTYTPNPLTKSIRVTVLGGGGGGGGAGGTAAGQQSVGCGGAGGGYSVGIISSGIVSTAVTVGAAGAASAAGFSAGGTGGTSSFGALILATGGVGGNAGVAISSFPNITAVSATPGAGSGGSMINATGAQGGSGLNMSSVNGVSGYGGSSAFGGGAIASSAAGFSATTPGSGGSGALAGPSVPAGRAGGAGAAGLVIVEEFS